MRTLERMQTPLDRASVRWAVVGSVGRLLLGGEDTPRDLDIVVWDADVERLEALLAVRFEPRDRPFPGRGVVIPAPDGGIAVELFAASQGAQASGAAPSDTEMWDHCRRVDAGGLSVLVAPPEDALVSALIAGDWDRIARIAAAGGPPPRIDYLRSRLRAVAAA